MSLKPNGRASARRNAPLLLLFLALPLSLLTHCSESSSGPAPVASAGSAGTASAGEMTKCAIDSDCGSRQPVCDGSNVTSFTPHCRSATCVWDTVGVPCANGCLSGACQGEGPMDRACSSVADCELPRSTCNGSELVYYTNATCSNGACQYVPVSMFCPTGCYNGGCTFTTTTASGPPPGGSSGGGQSGAGGQSGVGGSATLGGNGGEMSGGAGAGG
jgi:hypothetical protein